MYCTPIIADERESLLDDGVYGVGSTMTEHQYGSLPEKSQSVGATTGSCPLYSKTVIHDRCLFTFHIKGGYFNETRRKACDFYSTRPREQQSTVILESWDSSAESILLFVRVSAYAPRPLRWA